MRTFRSTRLFGPIPIRRLIGLLSVLFAAFLATSAIAEMRIDEKDNWYPSGQAAAAACVADHNLTGGTPPCWDYSVYYGQCAAGWGAYYYYSYYCRLGSPPYPNSCYRIYRACNEAQCPLGYTLDSESGLCVASAPPAAAKNAGAPKGCGGVGNPCNPATGNKFQTEAEFAPGGAHVEIVRYYNSQASRNVGFGYGWTSSLQSKRLYLFSGGSVHVRAADGKEEAFTCTDSACSGDADTRLTLTPDAQGYTLARRDGASERYDATGKLLSETDRAGRVTTYGYDTVGRLISITAPFGHKAILQYGSTVGPNYVSNVLDHAGRSVSYLYSTSGNLTRVTYPDETAKLYHYENTSFPHHLTGISYIVGATTTRYATYAYDASGKAISTEHAAGYERFTLTYDSGTQTTVTDAANNSEVMGFAEHLGVKNLTAKVNQGDGKSLTQTFDANNNLICRKDEEGRVTTYTYNATNQKTSTTEGLTGSCAAPQTTAATRTTMYQYLSPSLDLPTVIESPSVYAGQVKRTTISYSGNLPTTITQSGYTPAGTAVSRTVTLTYNSAGQVTAIDGPRTDLNDLTTLAYNTCTTGGACGQLSSITNALGQVTTFDSYELSGRATQMTDPNGLRTSYAYDPRGRVTTLTQTPPVGSARVTKVTYTTAKGDVARVTFPDGRWVSYTYNAARQLTRLTDYQGNYIAYGYDPKGNRTSEYTYDPANALVRQLDLSYDIRNRVSAINAAGSLTQQVHDAIGNLTGTTDPNNNPPTIHQYDALNRLLTTVNALGGTTAYSYDANDRLKQATAPNSATTQYSYDDLGNLLTETSPDRGTTTYTYDSAGNLASRTDARGITATYSHDALNRVTSIDYPGTTEDVSYTHDSGCLSLGTGRFCQVTDASGTTQYGYDAFGNVTTQQKTELGIVYTTAYSYDAMDRLSAVTYPDARLITYTRDTLGRISGVTATVNGATQTIVSTRSYRADGLLTTQSVGNGTSETRLYDLQGRLREQYLGSADTRLYGYDANRNVTSLQSLPQVAGDQYDALDRLTTDHLTSTPTSSVAFGYDANGNRTSDGANNYSYAPASNRLTQAGGATITTDAAGHITGDGTHTHAYNSDGHLQSVNPGGTPLGTYTYNFQRQRTRKATAQGTTLFHYDLAGNLILETDTNGNTNVAYLYAEATPLAHIQRAAGVDTLTYLHTDHEGTPRLATNSSQTVVWRWEGAAFGDTPPSGSATINLRFPGQYYDAESGLFYNWNRYYDPKLGRYLTSDPIGLGGGLNTYLYAYANPLRFIDPDGLLGFGHSGSPPSGWAWGGSSIPAPTCDGIWEPLREVNAPGRLATFFCKCRWVCKTCDGRYTGITTDNYGVPVAPFSNSPNADLENKKNGQPRRPKVRPGDPAGCACERPGNEKGCGSCPVK